VEQHHAIGREQVAADPEELPILRRPHMLEHADRDDPVETARHVAIRQVAIIDQLETHAIGDARPPPRASGRP